MAGKAGRSGGYRPGSGPKPKPTRRVTITKAKSVAILAAVGMTEREISIATGIARDELAERYADAMEAGPARIRLEILQALYRAALNGSVPAMRYFLRSTPAVAAASRLGKKAAAQLAAPNAQAGTDWEVVMPVSRA
jgi:transposase